MCLKISTGLLVSKLWCFCISQWVENVGISQAFQFSANWCEIKLTENSRILHDMAAGSSLVSVPWCILRTALFAFLIFKLLSVLSFFLHFWSNYDSGRQFSWSKTFSWLFSWMKKNMHVFASNWSDRQKEEWHQIKFLRVPNVDKGTGRVICLINGLQSSRFQELLLNYHWIHRSILLSMQNLLVVRYKY